MPSDFGDRARFDVNTSHIFPQGVLASIIMVEDGAGESGARAEGRCEGGLSLCSVTVATLLGVGSDIKLLEQKPRGLSLKYLSSLEVYILLSSTGSLSPREEQCWGKR